MKKEFKLEEMETRLSPVAAAEPCVCTDVCAPGYTICIVVNG